MDEKLIDKQVLYDGKKVRLELHHVRLDDGTKHTREVVVHPGAAVILPILPDDRILLIRTLRYSVKQYLLELPAGTLEPGESPMNCAGRELIEETNYVAGKLKLLMSFYASPGILTEKLHVFVATDLLPQAGQKDEGEDIELRPMTLAEALDAIQHGQIVDGRNHCGVIVLRAVLSGWEMSWENRDYHREDGTRSQGSFRLPKPSSLSIVLIAVCTVVYVLERVTPLGSYLGYWGVFTFANGWWWKQPWRYVTCQYLHENFGHLAWNALSIYFIVPILEQHWGMLRTFLFYTAAGAAGCLALALFSPFIGWNHSLVGASGAVLGVLGAIAYLAPKMDIAFMMIVPMSMRAIAILYAVIYSLTVLTDRDGSDAAHLGGLAFGVGAPWVASRLKLKSAADAWERRQSVRKQQTEVDEQQAVDVILEKVGRSGMQSLSSREKKRSNGRATISGGASKNT